MNVLFFIISAFLAALVGYYAQRIGLCMVRGVEKARRGKPSFLLAILCSSAFAWVAIFIASQLDLLQHFTAYAFSPLSFIGGLLFGLGAAFNHGCGVSTITRLVRGEIPMFATVCGWLIGWLILTPYMASIFEQRISYSFHQQGLVLFIFSIMLSFLITRFSKKNKTIWREMLLIGFMASLVFLYQPHWTPSGLLKDMSISIWSHGSVAWPDITRFGLVLSLVTGMFIAALKRKMFKLDTGTFYKYSLHLAAGILMGLGGVIAGGGNDSQLLIGIPSLSPASFVSVLTMILGIYLGRKLVEKFKQPKLLS